MYAHTSDARSHSGVTIKPAPHDARPIKMPSIPVTLDDHLLKILQLMGGGKPPHLLQSSLDAKTAGWSSPTNNGFVHSSIEAYSLHHCLVIRPEDIWTAIITQLSAYINAHAEELRHKFVAHEGKKKLVIHATGTRYSVDFGKLAAQMSHLIQDNVVDPELREWIIPAFTTTTKEDVMIASIIMMASMQQYFSYGYRLTYGLPSVTLLGEKADYELILHRLEKLCTLGKEPSLFASLLEPVLKRFIQSFDEPEAEEVITFWNKS